jgi:hypothetical protein
VEEREGREEDLIVLTPVETVDNRKKARRERRTTRV